MKRTALILAAAFLGTGCIVTDDDHCDERDVTVLWSGFAGPNAGDIDMSCETAGAQYVDLFLDGAQVVGPLTDGHFACGDYGVTIVGIGGGSPILTTEGVAADGATILYRDERPVTASCGSTSVTVEPASGWVDLQYQFYSNGSLLDPQVCTGAWLWLSIRDDVAGRVTVLSDFDFEPNAISCGGPLSLWLPTGPHTLQWMEERGTQAQGYPLRSSDCTDRAFTVPARSTAPVPVDLERSNPAVCQ